MALRCFIGMLVIGVLLACNQKATTAPTGTSPKKEAVLSKTDLNKLNYLDFELDRKVVLIVEPWDAYTRLSDAILKLKSADFSFFQDNEKATEQLFTDLRKTIPDTLKTQSIQSRITIVENMLYKLEDVQQLSNVPNTELAKSISEVLVAFSNLKFQLNKKLEKDSQNIVRPTG